MVHSILIHDLFQDPNHQQNTKCYKISVYQMNIHVSFLFSFMESKPKEQNNYANKKTNSGKIVISRIINYF